MLTMSYYMLTVSLLLILVMIGAIIVKPNTPTQGLMLGSGILIIMLMFVGRIFFKK